MKTDTFKVGSVDVYAPIGALVDADAESFLDTINAGLGKASPRVVLSLSEVPYLDSRALEGFLDLSDRLARQNLQLKLAALTPTCREILELTGLSSTFALFEDVQDAVKSYL